MQVMTEMEMVPACVRTSFKGQIRNRMMVYPRWQAFLAFFARMAWQWCDALLSLIHMPHCMQVWTHLRGGGTTKGCCTA